MGKLRRSIIATLLSLAGTLALAGPVVADTLQLRDGRTLEGRILAAGPTRYAFDGPGGLVLYDATDVSAARDGAGRPFLALDVNPDPVAIVSTVGGEGGVHVRRAGSDVSLSSFGAAAVVLDGDELRTGQRGQVSLSLPGGGMMGAFGDAFVRFRGVVPELQTGSLVLAHQEGDVSGRYPGGLITARNGRVEVTQLRGRTTVFNKEGRVRVRATAGYELELPLFHRVDFTAETSYELAGVLAHNANASDLWLEQGAQRIPIRPGLQLALLGTVTAAQPPPLPAPPPPGPLPPPLPDVQAGRVIRADASFAVLSTSGASRRVDRVDGAGVPLERGDVVATDGGAVTLESAGARVDVAARSELALAPTVGGAPLILRRGQTTIETLGDVALALLDGGIGGEVGLRGARASVTVTPAAGPGQDATATVAADSGALRASFGARVVAELRAGGRLTARSRQNRVQLEVPAGAPALSADLGPIFALLGAGRTASHASTGFVDTVELWNGARLEISGEVRGRVVTDEAGRDVLELEDGRRVLLMAGTYSLSRDQARAVVAVLPAGVQFLGSEQPGGTPPPPPPPPAVDLAGAPGGEELAFPNGAVLRLEGGHPRPRLLAHVGQDVQVEGPGGSIWLGPAVHATLARDAGDRVRFQTPDRRYVVHESQPGGPPVPMVIRLDAQGALGVQVGQGSTARTVESAPGTEFDVTVRRDAYVLAFVYGQAVYVRPGQHMSVTSRSGLRTQFAAERSSER